jgi:hypothetical protein
MEKQHKAEAQHKRTGASNIEYDLFNEVACLLKGNAALERYIDDARDAGDRDAETCFKTIHDQNKDSVGKLRELIVRHSSAPKAS